MSGLLLLMLLVECIAYVLYRDAGMSRLPWVPVSVGLAAFGGYDTVKRMPLIWGALAGALLAGITNLLSWVIGAVVLQGKFAMPDEAEPLLVASSLLIAAIGGSIAGVVAGLLARAHRRHRLRRAATRQLAQTAIDEPIESVEAPSRPCVEAPMADHARQRR